MLAALLCLIFVVAVKAGCDNQCSGHGTCGLDGLCTCYDNWGLGVGHISGDCSERMCPFDFAWADSPQYTGIYHQYAECSNQGICNRDSGECECFPGYTGSGCARMMCPNDCSGHGLCKTIQFQPVLPSNTAVLSGFADITPVPSTYFDWDYGKTFGCVCDPTWGDYDCSKRMCEYGTDIMNHRMNMANAQNYFTQVISFYPSATATAALSGTFALTFKSKLNETYTTHPIVLKYGTGSKGTVGSLADFLLDVRAALESLPNKVIDQVEVYGEIINDATRPLASTVFGTGATTGMAAGTLVSPYVLVIYIKFTGASVQGPQNMLTVKADPCGAGCTPQLTGLTGLSVQYNSVQELPTGRTIPGFVTFAYAGVDYQSFECGRRGKCDYSTGICQCFSGYTGQACNTITALV